MRREVLMEYTLRRCHQTIQYQPSHLEKQLTATNGTGLKISTLETLWITSKTVFRGKAKLTKALVRFEQGQGEGASFDLHQGETTGEHNREGFNAEISQRGQPINLHERVNMTERFLYDYIRRKNHTTYNIIANQPLRSPQNEDAKRQKIEMEPPLNKIVNSTHAVNSPLSSASIFDHESELTRNLRLKYGAMSLNIIPNSYKINREPYIFDPQSKSLVELKRVQDGKDRREFFAGVSNAYGDNVKDSSISKPADNKYYGAAALKNLSVIKRLYQDKRFSLPMFILFRKMCQCCSFKQSATIRCLCQSLFLLFRFFCSQNCFHNPLLPQLFLAYQEDVSILFSTLSKMLRFHNFLYSTSKRCFSTLLIAEHGINKLSNANLSVLNAALQLKQDIDVLVVGHQTSAVVDSAKKSFLSPQVKKIINVDDSSLKYQFSDHIQLIIDHLITKDPKRYTHFLASASAFGKDLIPRIAAHHDTQPITDVIHIIDQSTFVRPNYAGNAISHVKSNDNLKFMTIRATNFEKFTGNSSHDLQVENLDFKPILEASKGKTRLVSFVKEELSAGDKPELTSARIVVSGGRGLKSGENFKLLEDLANVLGNAAVGASRAAVDAGFVPNDLQVGQTGKVVAPELYIAVGISGAIQHLAGMKDSKVIVAINKDADAPIFQVANYGLVADLFKAVPELTDKLKQTKQLNA
eukprot:TRINITY_DN2710_c0_g1_i11.p1 TRINITY_DN2710_c0_g1~~TRINITY_DN2710_c0_g1_i11.p1  ORF type:complete len:695 (-),score=77.48 TRINITY_DN2710_c0_g1_i11:199-2283(-)